MDSITRKALTHIILKPFFMSRTLYFVWLFLLPLFYVQADEKEKTTLCCQVFDYRGDMVYFDCAQSTFIKAEFHSNPGEEHLYSFETDKLVTIFVNGREKFVLQPGDSIHAVIHYGTNGRPENVEITGTDRAVKENMLMRDLKQMQNSMRYKTQLLACAAIDTKPIDRMKDSYTYLEKANKLIAQSEGSYTPEFKNYIQAQIEGLVYGSLIEYPIMYADIRKLPIEKQGIGDYWTIIDNYQPRSDIASLRCMEYSEFLMQYCFYQLNKKAHAKNQTYTRPQTLEGIYEALTSFYKGNQLDSTLFLLLSNYIHNGRELEKVEPFLKEYKEKYNINKEFSEILDSLMQ